MRVLIITVSAICLFGTGVLFAQWDKYPTYEKYVSMMEKFQEDYPALCKVVEYGTSIQNRKLLAVKISDDAAEREAEPAFCYMGMLHGNETAGYVTLLRLAHYLLSNYESDTSVARLVDNIEIWICPLTNPDGAYYGGNNNITNARRYNANGVDLNRTFPPIPGAGNGADPENETYALINLIEPHHFIMSAMIHAGYEAVMYPWCSLLKAHPDKQWFIHTGTIYADLARENGPPGYFEDIGTPPGVCFQCARPGPDPYYLTHGSLIDYSVYYQQCRNVTLELSIRKLLHETDLENYWNYNREALLAYLEQVLYGIRGMVTDSLTQEPLEAKVFIKDHDSDSSWIFSRLPHGDYYRPIIEGAYDITFSKEGYHSKTISGVRAQNDSTILLNVRLQKIQTGIIPGINKMANSLKYIRRVEIYDLMGRKLKTIPANAFTNWKKGSGVYVVKFVGENIVKRKLVYLK